MKDKEKTSNVQRSTPNVEVRGVQDLVNAQVSINRAVFEVNQKAPRASYIDDCVIDASDSLRSYQRKNYAASAPSVAKKNLRKSAKSADKKNGGSK
jgi:hypothetical protein